VSAQATVYFKGFSTRTASYQGDDIADPKTTDDEITEGHLDGCFVYGQYRMQPPAIPGYKNVQSDPQRLDPLKYNRDSADNQVILYYVPGDWIPPISKHAGNAAAGSG